jgi:hypothetical protein
MGGFLLRGQAAETVERPVDVGNRRVEVEHLVEISGSEQ